MSTPVSTRVPALLDVARAFIGHGWAVALGGFGGSGDVATSVTAGRDGMRVRYGASGRLTVAPLGDGAGTHESVGAVGSWRCVTYDRAGGVGAVLAAALDVARGAARGAAREPVREPMHATMHDAPSATDVGAPVSTSH